MKFDIELFRQQASAGLQGWYIHFLSEVDTTEGLLGPYGREDIAKVALTAMLRAETAALDPLLTDSPLPVTYFAPFHHANVIQLTPHEFECLTDPD